MVWGCFPHPGLAPRRALSPAAPRQSRDPLPACPSSLQPSPLAKPWPGEAGKALPEGRQAVPRG